MAPEDVFSHDNLMSGVVAYVLNNAFNNDSIQRSGSNTNYDGVMICTKEPHPDMVEWFDSKC